jgi:lipoate-protein ligase A
MNKTLLNFSPWYQSMSWRLIELETHSGAMNMALDQAIYEKAAFEEGSPTIRFYQWEKPTISLGAYQSISDINLGAVKAHNIDMVRRMTGGRAVYHDVKDFTYSVVVPIRLFNYSISTAYRSICNSILIALKKVGIRAHLEHNNDVLVGDQKISGNAAKALDEGWYLQHGTIHYELNHKLLGELFKHDFKLFEDKSTSILEQKNISQEEFHKALREGFTADKDILISSITPQEMRRAKELVSVKYKHVNLPAGTFTRPRGPCSVSFGDESEGFSFE